MWVNSTKFNKIWIIMYIFHLRRCIWIRHLQYIVHVVEASTTAYPWSDFRLAPYREISMHGGCRKSLAPIGKYNPPLMHKLGYQMRRFSKWDSGNIRNADGRFRFQNQTHWLCLKDRCRNNKFIWQLFVSCVPFNIITRYWSYMIWTKIYMPIW